MVTHAMAGWLLSQPLDSRADRRLTTIAAVAADLDGIALLGGIDLYQKYHHTFGHNVFAWIATVLACTTLATSKLKVLAISAVAYGSHLFFDLLGSGREWPILFWWPLSNAETAFSPPFQWELASWQNFLIGIICMAAIAVVSMTKSRSVLEIFSSKLDREVIRTVAKWVSR